MGRIVRMSMADALAAGLLDREVVGLARRPTLDLAGASPALPRTDRTSTEGGTSPRKRRSKSKPAIHPRSPLAPAGDGSLSLLADGRIQAAEFSFKVIPVPKERAKIVRNPKTNASFGFTPARTKHFHDTIPGVIRPVMGGRGPISGPVEVEMAFAVATPGSWPLWKKEAANEGLIVPTGRPDMDNLEKALLDAFNGVLIQDDAFVVSRIARKIYAPVPHIRAVVRSLPLFDIHASRSSIDARRKLESLNDVRD